MWYAILLDECEDASDCNDNGECIDIMGTTVPSKLCFCNPGYFGDLCQNGTQTPSLYKQSDFKPLSLSFSPTESPDLTDATIDESQYSVITVLSDRLKLYARIIEVCQCIYISF